MAMFRHQLIRYRIIPLIAFALLLAPLVSYSQDAPVRAYFEIETASPFRIGDPIQVVFYVDVPQNIEIIEWPEIPEQWGDFEVVEFSEWFSESNGEAILYSLRLMITAWKTGEYRLPETVVTYRQLDTQQVISTAATADQITITSIVDMNDLNLRPAKPAIYLFYIPSWLYPIAIFVIASSVALFYVRRKRSDYIVEVSEFTETPRMHIRASVEALYHTDLNSSELYPLIANYLRGYVNAYTGLAATEMTTSELDMALQNSAQLPDALRMSLQQLLDQADLVKFADLIPGSAGKNLIDFAINWMDQLDEVNRSE